jgi:hypothetical protein
MEYADHRLMQGGTRRCIYRARPHRGPSTARHWVSLLGSVFDNRSADKRHPTSGSPARMDGKPFYRVASDPGARVTRAGHVCVSVKLRVKMISSVSGAVWVTSLARGRAQWALANRNTNQRASPKQPKTRPKLCVRETAEEYCVK